MKNSSVEIAKRYVNGLKTGDLSGVPFAPDILFESPLTAEKLHGVESLMEFLSAVLPIVKDARIKQSISEGNSVCLPCPASRCSEARRLARRSLAGDLHQHHPANTDTRQLAESA